MFYIVRNSKRHGPFSVDQLRTFAAGGKLHDFDLVIRVGEESTRLLADVPELRDCASPLNADVQKSTGNPCEGSGRVDGHGAGNDGVPKTNTFAHLIGQVWSGGKVAAAIGSVSGFIGDFLEPLAPINSVLFLLTLTASIVLGIAWFRLDRTERMNLDHWFPQQSFIFTSFLLVAFGGWFLLQQLDADPGRGVLGANLAFVAQAQDALLQLKQDVAIIKGTAAEILRGTKTIADTSRDIKEDTAAIHGETAGIHADTSAIRESIATIGSQRGLVSDPKTAADHYHNAMVHMRDGNHAAAEESFKRFFDLDQSDCYDAYGQYASLVLGNYSPSRARQLIVSLSEKHRQSLSARLVAINETVEDNDDAQRSIRDLIKEHPQFLPAYLYLAKSIAPGLVIDDLAIIAAAAAFRAAGGVEAFKSFIVNPAEGDGEELLKAAEAFGAAGPVDPMRRLFHGVQVDPDITLLWLGVNDLRPGREIILTFPGDAVVKVPLDSPNNPAAVAGGARGPVGLVRGSFVALELPRYQREKKPAKPSFVPRAQDDVRMFPHAGNLTGVAIGSAVEVEISYVDAEGRKFSFPKPVKLFPEGDGEGIFAVDIKLRGSFDPTPVLQITPASPMARVEVSGRAEGPFVPALEHMSVPTMNEVACGAVPFLIANRGSTKLWVRGTSEEGNDLAGIAIVIDVPPAVRWKTYEPALRPAGRAEADTTVELKFEPPNTYTDYYIDRVAFSPDGQRLAAMIERGGIVVWDVGSGRQTHLVKAETGKALAFSTDGAQVSNGLDVVALDTATKISCLQRNYDTFGAAVSASFAIAATVDRSQRVAFFEFPSGKEGTVVELGHDHGFPSVVAISPDDAVVAVAGPHVDVVWIIDRRAGKVQTTFDVPARGITSLAFSFDGKQLLAAGPNSCVRLWNLATGDDTAARHGLDDDAPTVAWTTRGVPLVADVGPAALTVTDALTGKSVAQVDGPVKNYAISPTGQAIAIAKKTSVVVRRID